MPRMDSPFNRISRDGVCKRQDMTRQYRHACASIGYLARFSRDLETQPAPVRPPNRSRANDGFYAFRLTAPVASLQSP